MWQRDARDRTVLQPTPAASVDVRICSYPTKLELRYGLVNFSAKKTWWNITMVVI